VRFSADTGEPLEIVRSASLKAARTDEDAKTLAKEVARGQDLGLGTTLVSPESAHHIHPFLQSRGLRSILHTPGDVYFEPSHIPPATRPPPASWARRCCRTPRSPGST